VEAMTMAISVVKNRQPEAFLTPMGNKFTPELTLLVMSEAKRDVEDDEQLTISCFKMSVGYEMVTKLANPTELSRWRRSRCLGDTRWSPSWPSP
jgi:hypothetical protein